MEDEIFDETKVDDRTDKEYEYLLFLFEQLLDKFDNQTIDLEEFQEIVEARVMFAFGHCVRRFGIDLNEALDIERNHDESYLTPFEIEKRKALVAALDNLVDFATAEETQMYMDMEEQNDDDDPERIFHLYNNIYATTENRDIDYASSIAAWWVNLPEETTLMYMTQGDERVRDSHRALEGLSFPKSCFPEWSIPPIDWRCRCYLVESFTRPNYMDIQDIDSLIGNAVNPIFKRSLAKGGPIFGEDHPYFTVDKRFIQPMKTISSNIKSKYNIV